MDINANVVPDGTEVVLVAYSPNAENPVMGDPFTFTKAISDKDKYNTEGGTLHQDYGKKAEENDVLDKVAVTETKDGQDVPAPADKVKSKVIKGDIPDPSADGTDQTVTVEVTYADGTKEDVTVTIEYGEAKDAYDPAGQTITVDKGSQPNAADGIANKKDLPENTTYEWAAPVDTNTAGTKSGTVAVRYPDGSTDQVTVDIIVKDTATDTELYTAQGGVVDKPYGQTATEDDVLAKVSTDAPDNKVKSIEVMDAIPTTGQNQPVNVKVTYADGSNDTAIVTVNYGSAADAYDPAGQTITVDKGSQPNPEDGIKNKDDLPEGTKYEWKGPIDTDKPGETTGTVVVIYPDKTTDEVEVKVNVIDPSTDADKYDPKTEPEVIKPGEKPDLTDNVTNLDELPEGTKIKDITPDGAIDTNKPGEYEGKLEITYPDGSKETVTVKVTVEKPEGASTDNDKKGDDNKAVKESNVAKAASPWPKTGDFANLGMYVAAAIASIVTLAGLFFVGKRRKGEDER